MKIRVSDIGEREECYDIVEPSSCLDEVVAPTGEADYRFPDGVHLQLRLHRAADEVFVNGKVETTAIAACARCLEEFELRLGREFSRVLLPAGESDEDEDVDLGYYRDDEIDVSDIVRETILLNLPTRPLCRQDCRGLCPKCGANLNEGSCSCPTEVATSPFAVLRDFKRGK